MNPEVEDPVEEEQRPVLERAVAAAVAESLPVADWMRRLAAEKGYPYAEEFSPDEDRISAVPARLWVGFGCLPIESPGPGGAREDEMPLICGWPPTRNAERWLVSLTGKFPLWHFGDPREIEKSILSRFGVGSLSLEDGDELPDEAEEDAADGEEDEEAAVVRFVNEVIDRALQDRATDIHFEPYRDLIRIRYRIDGVLVPIAVPGNLARFHASIISRIKILAKLNISEKRRPQDGRIAYSGKGREIDIRLSTFPTIHGESISLRLLDQTNQVLTVEDLGLPNKDLTIIERTLALPHGIILVTGPTGSGKTTSLNAFLRLIDSEKRRVMTVEDPVEYEMPGINQTQVREEIGLTFANVLRHILRQDPDVIMIGEIRDQDTADIAVRSALTGHLVFSTLHTNDAPGALARLVDMGVEPFLIASAVELIIAQRLVRRLCHSCRRKGPPDPVELKRFEQLLGRKTETDGEVYHSVGCDACRNLGYRGRVGLYEILTVRDKVHDMILANASAREIREAARTEGMKTMAEAAWEHVRAGTTTLEECLRVIETLAVEDEESPYAP